MNDPGTVPTPQLRGLLAAAAALHAGHWLVLRADSADPPAVWLVVLVAAALVQATWIAGLFVVSRPSSDSAGELIGNAAALAAYHLVPPHGRPATEWAWFAVTLVCLGVVVASALALAL